MNPLTDPRIVAFKRSEGAPSLFDAYDAAGNMIWHSFDFNELAASDNALEAALTVMRYWWPAVQFACLRLPQQPVPEAVEAFKIVEPLLKERGAL